MTDVPLARHLALSKNVRGLGVYDRDDPPDRPFFTWLSRKHQYRAVGFPPALWDHPSIDISNYETFELLQPPVPRLKELVDGDAIEAPAWVLESLLVASAYVVPLFIHRDATSAFEPFVRWRLETDSGHSEDQVLRHMRILGYGMLDSYASSTESGWNAIDRGEVDGEIQRRETVAAEDGTDRCWRLLGDDSPGDTWVGGYFDVLPAVRSDATGALDPNAAIGLGLVGAFIVDPPYEE